MRALPLSVAFTLLCGVLPLSAQRGAPAPTSMGVSAEYRAMQHQALEMRRQMVLAMVDSMMGPGAAAPGAEVQRAFLAQVRHFVDAETGIAHRWLADRSRASVPVDTALTGTDREAMTAYVNRQYDFLAGLLMLESDASRSERVDFLGVMKPRWQVWDEIHQRSLLNAGRIAAMYPTAARGTTPLSVPF